MKIPVYMETYLRTGSCIDASFYSHGKGILVQEECELTRDVQVAHSFKANTNDGARPFRA